MDLKQQKLTKAEWETMEIPVSKSEIIILDLIRQGFSNVNININNTDSIFSYLKIPYNSQIEKFLYIKYFGSKIKELVETYNIEFITFDTNKKDKSGKNGKTGNDDESKSDEKSDERKMQNTYNISLGTIIKLKSSDEIRLLSMNNIINTNTNTTNNTNTNTNANTNTNTNTNIYEFILIKHLENMIVFKYSNNEKWIYYYFTLTKLIKNNIINVNTYVKDIINIFIENYECEVNLLYIIKHSDEFIEKNTNILKYADLKLYEHQKEIFTVANSTTAKLILYIAPTGTGKTLTPLGLSEKYKIIFVCATRHVSLALARAAISINKKIAFAFGCSDSEDVRLHYFAAKDYTKDKKSGQIKKVDNTVGDKVEIMICDIRSYLHAMHYMAAFNEVEDIITYWDEPTITMDYEHHELHTIIHNNWKHNIIPNMVLSSATLPKLHELTDTIADFKYKFPDAVIYNIVSHECNKSIPLINNNGYLIMPHYIEEDYSIILQIVENCEDNLTLLRYFDLKDASEFIYYVFVNNYNTPKVCFDKIFHSINDIDMKSIKKCYLKVLKNINPLLWNELFHHFKLCRIKKIHHNNTVDIKGNIIRSASLDTNTNTNINTNKTKELVRMNSMPLLTVSTPLLLEENNGSSGIYITTKDAYTLTDGPTIFIADNLQKITKFCIQQANIPTLVMKNITEKIEFNNQINNKIEEIEKALEFEEIKLAAKMEGTSSESKTDKSKKSKSKIATKMIDKTENNKINKMKEDIVTLKSMIKHASIDDTFVPNKLLHLNKWAPTPTSQNTNAFTSNIEEDVIVSIMLLKNVEDSWKILLLLGIGVFTEHKSIEYTEIMKKLVDQQKLYLIIADSDYIFGTNYQFCHCYLSKDLILTQEKIIQALGRVGRNNIQQDYSIRFRDDTQVKKLLYKIASEDKPEVINMNKLFNSQII
jgi:hypothetical protein